MFKIYNFFYSLILTFYSIIKIYLITEKNSKKDKVLLFYFPVKIYQSNIYDLIEFLKSKNKTTKNNYKIFIAYNHLSSGETIGQKNSFFLDLNYLKYIPFSFFFLNNIDIFLSSYLTYVFPPKSINIYLSHDIYDSPMTEGTNEKKLFKKINELDYIFASSSISKKYYFHKLKKYNKFIKPKIKNTGYLKLDNIYKIIKKRYKNQKKTVLIAPGFSIYFQDINLKNYLEDIIKKFIFKLKMRVIYRPHPLDLNHKGDYKFVKKIQNIFSKNSKFKLDNSVSYIESFNSAKFMVTDVTSSAYTFAYSTNKPVIFFSPNEQKVKRNGYHKTNYFKDRKKIGILIKNISSLKKATNLIDKNKVNLKKKIVLTRNSRIEYFNNSKQRMFLEINKIANNL